MSRFSGSVHVRTCGKRINGSVFTAKNEKHQLRLVLKLNAEPIPAGLLRGKLVGEKFMIHPGQAGDIVALAIQLNGPGCSQTRLGKIVTGATNAFGFLTYAVFAMKHQGLFTAKAESELEVFVLGRELLRAVFVPDCRPVSIPNSSFLFAHSGDSRTGAIDSLGVVKMSAIDVAEGEMSKI